MQYSFPFLIVPSFGSYHDFLDSGLVLTGNYWSHGSPLLSGNHHSESFTMASASLLTAYGLSVSQMAKYIFVCHSEALECFRVLVGFVLCMLSTYMTSLVVISATISAWKRCSNRLDSQFFCRRFIFFNLCFLFCVTYTGIQHDLMLSEFLFFYLFPCLYWCWFVSLLKWNWCSHCGLSTFIYKQNQQPAVLVYANKL
jgi:hypothetical protein